jgi:hypothetical protein
VRESLTVPSNPSCCARLKIANGYGRRGIWLGAAICALVLAGCGPAVTVDTPQQEIGPAPAREIDIQEIAPGDDATQPAISPAARTVDEYFVAINSAKERGDLGVAWNLLTPALQCNPSDNCSYAHYEQWWWDWQVRYTIYDCRNTLVDTELVFYSRGTGGPSSAAEKAHVR